MFVNFNKLWRRMLLNDKDFTSPFWWHQPLCWVERQRLQELVQFGSNQRLFSDWAKLKMHQVLGTVQISFYLVWYGLVEHQMVVLSKFVESWESWGKIIQLKAVSAVRKTESQRCYLHLWCRFKLQTQLNTSCWSSIYPTAPTDIFRFQYIEISF